jgi:hypothetical protein
MIQTKEEILKKNWKLYADFIVKDEALQAMQEYAESYHQQKLSMGSGVDWEVKQQQ